MTSRPHFGRIHPIPVSKCKRGVFSFCSSGFGKKRGLLEKGSFRKGHFLEILETSESPEFPENPQTVEKKGVSRDFRDSRDFSSEKTPFVMTPFSGSE